MNQPKQLISERAKLEDKLCDPKDTKAIIIKICNNGGNLREIEEDTLEIDPHKYGQLILDEGTKTIQWRLASLFNNDARTIPHTKTNTNQKRPQFIISHISL